jgi:hypothetical protein
MTMDPQTYDERSTTRGASPGFPGIVAILAGLSLIGLGLWAFLDPRSFFEQLATWRPFNEHFLHDLGAFQIGLGAVLLLAAMSADALVVALGGVGIGSAMHALSHLIDRGDGGRDSDPFVFGVLALIILAAALYRWRTLRRAT